MNELENKYKELAVRVCYNGNFGSGCLFQSDEEDHSYVFTAKHCISEEGNKFDLSKLNVYRHTDFTEDKKLDIKKVHFHDVLDLAVIIIKKIELNCTNIIRQPQKNMPVTIYGYPFKLKKEKEPRENINCKITFRHDTHFELTSDSLQFTFSTETPENIKGLSGSGIFIEENDSISFVGIFTRLKGPDGIYNKYCAHGIIELDEIFKTNNLKPLFYVQNNLDNIVRDPKTLRKVFYLPYTIESEPYYYRREIDTIFQEMFLSTKNIWVSGASGVGKTNLIFRNLKINKANYIHFDLSGLPSNGKNEYFNYINNELVKSNSLEDDSDTPNIYDKISHNLCKINNSKEDTILFVDEVPIVDLDCFNNFLTGFVAIAEKFCNKVNALSKIKWIIVTRINPRLHFKSESETLHNDLKASRNFNFKNIEIWNNIELMNLLYLLEKTLDFSLDSSTEENIVEISKGLPSVLKDTIERSIFERCPIEKAIEMLKSENY